MSAFLRIQTDGGFRDAAILDSDDQLIIGRSSSADVAVPTDNQMSSSHASLKLVDGKCLVRDLGSTNGTFLNNEPLTEGEMGPGDQLRCGGTVFVLEIPGVVVLTAESAGAAATGAGGAAAGAAAARKTQTGLHTPQGQPAAERSDAVPDALRVVRGFVSEQAAEIVSRFELQEMLEVPPEAGETTAQYIHRAAERNESPDCLQFLARALPKRCGVWWAVQCVRAADALMKPEDATLLELVTQWVASPSDSLRRQAMTAAEKLKMSTPASWTGVAVFWSHGSMAPPDAPAVPPADNLSGKAVFGAAALAAVVRTPENAPKRRQQFADLGMKIASGELTWK